MYYDELYHHGILGQKWGVRRYQNKDGSLTAAGKKRRDRYERAADAAERDADDLRKHGYIKEAEAVQRVADKNRSKSKTANAGPNNREDHNKAHDKSKNKSVESMSGADRNKLQRRAAAKKIVGTMGVYALIAASPHIIKAGKRAYVKSFLQAQTYSAISGIHGKAAGLNEVKGGFTTGFKHAQAGREFLNKYMGL